VARQLRSLLKARKGLVALTYPDGRVLKIHLGTSVLEASRGAGIPHASICGGRGRCSTCRVRVSDPSCDLAGPSPDEQHVLRRVAAAPDVRLACQLRPQVAVHVWPLISPAAVTAKDGFVRPSQFQGLEREIAILFADIRGFTQLSEHKLPYDVVFILNSYFAEMGAAVEETGGRVDKFMGDGVMALFGLDASPQQACRQALGAAHSMFQRLDQLNKALAPDLPEPLRIGIGVHCGPVIVGEMGYGATMDLTAIGDAVNTASRLEALCKPYGCELVVSSEVSDRAGLNLSSFPLQTLDIRGRKGSLAAYTLNSADLMPVLSQVQS
jgi:adenylate cyclase